MRLRITGPNGEPVTTAARNLLSNVLSLLRDKSAKMIQWALLYTTKNHIQQRYPNSQHWDPNKVTEAERSTAEASINIDIPGATRNYHDLDIYPRRKKALTIPISPLSQRKSVSDFLDDNIHLFRPKDTDYLAMLLNGRVEVLFLLRKHVHQKQDNTLLPTDKTYYTNIWARLNNYLDQKANTISN